jgi:hypothetical protein
MFSFTTQTVYNQIGPNNVKKEPNGKKPSLRIGNTRFDAATITSIQVKAPSAEQLASVTFDMNDVIPESGETTARIVLYLGLSMGSQDSFYSNALVYKGKPFYVEFPVKVTDTAAALANKVKAIADKYILFQTGEKETVLNVTASNGTVTFTGVNGYQLIKKAQLQTYDPKAHTIDCCSEQGDFIDIKVGVPVIYEIKDGVIKTKDADGKQYIIDESGAEAELGEDQIAILPGLEAFGDYNWIIHNLRLPTAANTGFWAPAKQADELPIVGQVYTQFIITMCVDRDGIAGTVVGDRATSVTTHVLYVAGKHTQAGSPAKTVYEELSALATAANINIATTADNKLVNPFNTSKALVA